jgi:hypothetical protein
VGTIFIIYEPLKPLVYSVGGILLAFGMLALASQYRKLMNKNALFTVLLIVEVITLIIVLIFLFFQKSLLSALFIYICYQVTFLFGSYVMRVETLVLRYTKLYSLADMLKQTGYLIGLGGAFACYEAFEYCEISDKIEQVYYLHYILVVVQFIVIFCLVMSFSCNKLLRANYMK